MQESNGEPGGSGENEEPDQKVSTRNSHLESSIRGTSSESEAALSPADAGPFDSLPRLSWGQVRLERLLSRWSPRAGCRAG